MLGIWELAWSVKVPIKLEAPTVPANAVRGRTGRGGLNEILAFRSDSANYLGTPIVGAPSVVMKAIIEVEDFYPFYSVNTEITEEWQKENAIEIPDELYQKWLSIENQFDEVQAELQKLSRGY